ncbi:esterase/lipase family protein [Massilia niabensis]|uniref:Esterase/lipase family protein n=1 Tax=Massilia niabensis TaxID=544910 RepID=A0ABW0L7E7_9BURK
MSEKTRPLPPPVPLSNGGWEVNSFMSSEDYTLRGLALMPSNSIVPVIVVPGIMGTNLRAKRLPGPETKDAERNQRARPGDPVWRPPNGKSEGLRAADRWDGFTPTDRQLLFDSPTLEVDDSGPVGLPNSDDGYVLKEEDVRERGWGEVHAESYGPLLYALETRLNQTFWYDAPKKKHLIKQHWQDVMACDPKKWGLRDFAPLTEGELKKHAQHYFPVYSLGYCWLEDCQTSSLVLEKRILEIIAFWRNANRRCDKVILVTHSMGGLVARACAKRISDKIAGVIHGVMPALGAPVAYRRIACGTEASSPGNGPLENFEASRAAMILGRTTDKTTPVLATSPGALELLPNHLYPQPWLHVRVIKSFGPPRGAGYGAKDDVVRLSETSADYLHLPSARAPNPYDLYRNLTCWYRLINPALADPAGKYTKKPGGVELQIRSAIATAEQFHRSLGDYYHPNTYAFYGDDQNELSYGRVSWVARQGAGSACALTTANVADATFLGHRPNGQRRVLVEGKAELHFEPEPQDVRGDGTVPRQSGAGVAGHVKQVFPTQGYDHQGSYNNDDMLKLTLRLIVKIAQELS